MPTSTEKALREFFTPERLEDYRDLHECFPLWCGDWPEDSRHDPACWYWLTPYRLHSYASSIGLNAEIAWFEFEWPEPKWKNPPIPILKLGKPESGERTLREVEGSFSSLAEAALASAIKYTGEPWRSGYGPSATGEPWLEPINSAMDIWVERFEAIVRKPDPRFYGLTSRPSGPTGTFLAHLRDTYLATSPSDRKRREDLRWQLKDYWSRIGREIGVLPRVAGGAETTFSDALLDRLASETQSLIAQVRSFAADADELNSVRQLLTGRDDPLAAEQRTLLRELKRRKDDPALKKREQSMIKNRDRAFGTEVWVARLRFPVLTKEEIKTVREQRINLRQPGQASVASAARLIAPHLDLNPKTLETKLSKSRRS